jgi:hypothetical protein
VEVLLGGDEMDPGYILPLTDQMAYDRWLFYIEGTITIIVALLSVFILPDFPSSTTTFLTPLERALAVKRMSEDAGMSDQDQSSSGSHTQTRGLQMALADWKIWWLALALCSMVVSLSFNAFFPTLSATMGFGRTGTLLLCVPPWLVATVVAFAVTRFVSQLSICPITYV